MHSAALPLISIIFPAFNEEALLRENITQVCQYLDKLHDQYQFEILIVNDGSSDNTGSIADQLAEEQAVVSVLHHPTNFGVGQALKFGFANTRGDYVVTMDIDLSYDVEHIKELVERIIETHSKIVLASPYMEGGTISNVPTVRRVLSILGNRFLKFFSYGSISTITSMVRVYDGPFIRAMRFRSTGLDLMPETLYKAMIVRAQVSEMPARLDWGPQLAFSDNRTSSMRLIKHVLSTIKSGFLLRPMFFLFIPGIVVGLAALYSDFVMLTELFQYLEEARSTDATATMGVAIGNAYAVSPHSFVLSMLLSLLAIQLLGLGVLSLQNKRHYEDLYYLNSTHMHALRKSKDTEPK